MEDSWRASCSFCPELWGRGGGRVLAKKMLGGRAGEEKNTHTHTHTHTRTNNQQLFVFACLPPFCFFPFLGLPPPTPAPWPLGPSPSQPDHLLLTSPFADLTAIPADIPGYTTSYLIHILYRLVHGIYSISRQTYEGSFALPKQLKPGVL